MMNEVARARVALTNPQKRAAYDLTLEPGRKAPTPAPSVPASPSVLPPVIEAVEREKPGPNLLQRIIAYATANPVLWIVPAACIGVIAIIIARATRPSPLPKTLAISVSPSTKSSPAIIPPRTMGIPAHPLVSVEPKPLPATTSTALVPGHESPLPATAPTIPVEIAKPKPPQPPTIVSTRKPLPSTDLREKSSKLVDQIYGDDIAAAKTQKAKADLARKMLAEVGALGDHDADRFVLLGRCADLAVEALDLDTAMKAIDAAAREFQIDSLKIKARAMDVFAQNVTTSQDQHALEKQINDLIDQAIAADRYDVANYVVQLAQTAAKAINDPVWIRQVDVRQKEVNDAQAELKKGARSPLHAKK